MSCCTDLTEKEAVVEETTVDGGDGVDGGVSGPVISIAFDATMEKC